MASGIARIEQIFTEALAKCDDGEREAFLEDACGEDAELRRKVELLLDAHRAAGSFLQPPAAPNTTESLPPMETVGESIGPYKLLEQIGEGGFGVVYLAEQRQTIRRRVALKILKPGMDTRQVVARFEAERQALALMDHANIAKVFDAGATATGRPYFVMELVKGIAITDYCNQCGLTTEGRLKLFVAVCQAVQHAHQKGVIHRDIKPSNVLVAMHEGEPTVKVIDFGVAKAINQRLTEDSLHTGFAQVLGTPLYMSPEQAEMSPLEIDTRGDVYSLGVLLYELLTGTTPFTRERFRQASFDEVRRIIREEEPPTPSSRLSTLDADLACNIARQRRIEPGRLVRSIRGDLDWIVMKCLEKDRTRRYETVAALGHDIEHFLANEPVVARPPSRLYRLRKFARRNRLAICAGVAVAASLVIGTGVSTWQALVASRAKLQAEAAQAQTMEALQSATDDVIEKLITSKDELGPNEREYLDAAIERWERFAAYEGASILSRRMRAEGKSQVANLLPLLGQDDAAEANYQSSIHILEELNRDIPAEPEFLHDLATCHSRLANLHAARVNYTAARAEYGAAHGCLLQLGKLGFDERQYKQLLAMHHHNWGNLLRRLGDLRGAQNSFETALGIWLELTTSNSDAKLLRYQAATHNDLGTVLIDSGAMGDALGQFQQALDIQMALVRRSPDRERERELARTYGNRAVVYAVLGDLAAARTDREESLKLFRDLAHRFAANRQYQRELADACNGTGAVLIQLKEYEEASDLLAESLNASQALGGVSPTSVDLILQAVAHGYLGNLIRDQRGAAESLESYNNAARILEPLEKDVSDVKLIGAFERSPTWEKDRVAALKAVSQAKSGDVRTAVSEVERLMQHTSPQAAQWYNFACVFSIASVNADGNHQDHVKQAVDQLWQAVQAGFDDVKSLKSDPDLDAVRDHPDFQEILAELERRSAE